MKKTIAVIAMIFVLFPTIAFASAKLIPYDECKCNLTLYLLRNAELLLKEREKKEKLEDKDEKEAKIDTIIDDDIVEIICDEAENAGVSSNLMVALCETESGGNPNATGYSGDTGLFQIIPEYHRDRMYKLGVNNLYDPQQNTRVAADILKDLSEECNGDPYATLMFYNEGYNGKHKAQNGYYSSYAKRVVNRYLELETQ